LKEAIQQAKRNIEAFHQAQVQAPVSLEVQAGVKCWQKTQPIDKVGLYIPGGTAPLFSTVLMLAVPAQLAGCGEIVLCSPPGKEGKIHPAILYTAHLCGIRRIFKIGGVQAIGAMAYGTETVPQVYKIFGPGNRYVTAAKQLVSLEDTAIDMPAGPSEVLVMADQTAIPAFVAADLLSQAEHGSDSQVILLTSSAALAEAVQKEIQTQCAALPRATIAWKALENSKIILLKDREEMLRFSNAYAPEHLIISTKDYRRLADRVTNAGSVFLGNYSPESAGDYASGTNHTLPTRAYARAFSGLNLDSFKKKISFQEISREGLRALGPTIEIMAENNCSAKTSKNLLPTLAPATSFRVRHRCISMPTKTHTTDPTTAIPILCSGSLNRKSQRSRGCAPGKCFWATAAMNPSMSYSGLFANPA
jgi:histidinol dehydrogenase